jgi:hypothetical protein
MAFIRNCITNPIQNCIGNPIQSASLSFSPADLGLDFFQNYMDTSTITHDESVSATQGLVSLVNCAAGTINDGSQSNAARRPTTGLNTTPSGKNCLTFDKVGLSKSLVNGSVVLEQPSSIVVVARRLTTHDGDYDSYLIDGNSGAYRNIISNRQVGDGFMYFAGTLREAGSGIGTGWNVHEIEVDGANSKYFINGVQQDSGNIGDLAMSGFVIGNRHSDTTNSGLTGDIACALGRSGVFTSSERANLYAWILSEAGV